ncbi:MAG TPA: hypothetical protein VJ399_00315 [Patescibacteria group bacterium]|nr:hypothetical protein [Patescibacteria group bacterium]
MPKPKNIKSLRVKTPKGSYLNVSEIPFLKLIFVFILLNLATAAAVLIANNKIPPQVPLYYGYARGDRQLIESSGLVLPSLMSVGIITVNTIISLFIGSGYLKRALVISSFLATALSLITTVKIMLLVGSF